MGVHDWTRVDAGIFHDLHNSWLTHLKESLNRGLLPEGYYALAEQHATLGIADILTLDVGDIESNGRRAGGLALAPAPPMVSLKRTATSARMLRRTLTIRHISGHRIVAMVEIVSPANKDRPKSVEEFVDKAHEALNNNCHLLVIDLIRPGKHDPHGIPWEIWKEYDKEMAPPKGKTLSAAAFVSYRRHEAYWEFFSVGDPLPDMPLFLEVDYHITAPLRSTYEAAYKGVPAFWRKVIEGKAGKK